jgi:hypothetical protein
MKLVNYRTFKNLLQKPKAQALVEFAITLPFLLLILYGVVELARLAFIFSSVSNASRAAARYGSGAGENSEGIPHYQDCEGIRDVAKQSAYITDFKEINITYDRGITSDGTQIPVSGVDPRPGSDSCSTQSFNVRNGDRIIVEVSALYEPIVPIVPLDPLEIVSSNARTFIVSIPIMGSSVPTGFSAETSTPSAMPVNSTNTPRPTAAFTSTRIPIDLTEFAKNLTNAPTITPTFTPSLTPLPSLTPTITPTRISCQGITGIDNGKLRFKDNFIEMEISNHTGYPLAVSEVYIAWNHDTGHRGDNETLHLVSASLNGQSWEGDLYAPSQYIQGYRPYIPTGSSVVRYNFNQTYDVQDGTERVIISLMTPGCEGYPIDSDK